MNESKTPRSDAAIVSLDCDDSCCPIYVQTLDGSRVDSDLVPADFARQLETELSNAETLTTNALKRNVELETELAAAKLKDSQPVEVTAEIMEGMVKLKAELAASKAREDKLAEALKQCRPAPCDCREWSGLDGGEHSNECSMRMSNECAMRALEEWRASK